MNSLDELKKQIRKTIQESEEYKEYRELYDYISRHPDLKRQIDEFRKENFRIQYSDEVEDAIEAGLELNNRFADLRSEPVVDRFLAAEMCLCRLVQEICMAVADSVDFDMDFLS